MSRWFYDDSLAAAFMAKHFGMQFHYPEEYGNEIHCILEVGGTGLGYREMHTAIRDNIYIHPDSLHLLEPQVGDLVTLLNTMGAGSIEYVGQYTSAAYIKEMMKHGGRIIQRNGIAFMRLKKEI